MTLSIKEAVGNGMQDQHGGTDQSNLHRDVANLLK